MSDPAIDAWLATVDHAEALAALRELLLDSPLTETEKWGGPIYTFNDGNVVGMGPRKDGISLGFFKGLLLDDPDGVLTKPGPYAHEGRQMRFADAAEVVARAASIRAYVDQAIDIERKGLKIPPRPVSDTPFPEELADALDANPALLEAFEALTPGRQRSWQFHIDRAKQVATRRSRVEKAIPAILAGKGQNER